MEHRSTSDCSTNPSPVNAKGLAMKMGEFVRWCVQEGPWEGNDLDGADVQRKAVECGLLTETKYDPALHGEADEWVEAGDAWYVFCDELKALD